MADKPEPMRGLDEAAQHDKSWGPRLKELAEKLSAGDKSVLVAMLGEGAAQDAVSMTSRGSPNDWFWAHLSKVGLMQERPDAVPEPLQAHVVAYAVTPTGKQTLPGLLRSFF